MLGDALISPLVITAIAPSSPLTIVTNPKDPRQPGGEVDGICVYCILSRDDN